VSDKQTNQTLGTDRGKPRSVSPYKAGIGCRCPNCGDSPLYVGLLTLRENCEGCGFDLSGADIGDGAQVFVIFILGVFCIFLGFLFYSLGLPKWVIMSAMFVFIIGGTIVLLRIFKATLLALQYHHDAREGALSGDEDV
jgi:uncharacterized protein (DUF983 family)